MDLSCDCDCGIIDPQKQDNTFDVLLGDLLWSWLERKEPDVLDAFKESDEFIDWLAIVNPEYHAEISKKEGK